MGLNMKEEIKLPSLYEKLTQLQRKQVREEYIKQQDGKCMYCGGDIEKEPSQQILDTKINLKLFPPNFLKHPIHLQHNRDSGLTEGSVHARCNAILWQYHGR